MFSYLSESVSTLGHFRVTFASVSKRVFVRNHANENVFHLHVHFHANKTHFRLNGFAQGLVLKMRQKSARKWPIYNHDKICFAFFECCQNLLCNDIFTSVYCLVFNPCCTQRNILLAKKSSWKTACETSANAKHVGSRGGVGKIWTCLENKWTYYTPPRKYEVRELISPVGLVPKVISLKLFLDMVPS